MLPSPLEGEELRGLSLLCFPRRRGVQRPVTRGRCQHIGHPERVGPVAAQQHRRHRLVLAVERRATRQIVGEELVVAAGQQITQVFHVSCSLAGRLHHRLARMPT